MSMTRTDEETEAQTLACAFDDRGVVEVAGEDAATFLQGLVTNTVQGIGAGEARYAALLTPQGKILFDFLISADFSDPGRRFFLDCPLPLVADLVKRVSLYRLRAKVAVVDQSETLGVVATWSADHHQGLVLAAEDVRANYADPRRDGLGRRVIVVRNIWPDLPPEVRGPAAAAAYERHRILLEIPKGGVDFAYGDAFPHEANFDRLHGVDFNKGCYVGQEVVSRVEHRGLARKRIVAVRFDAATPPVGSEVMAGEVNLGVMGSSTDGFGLALLRVDRAEAALAAGMPIEAAGTKLGLPGLVGAPATATAVR